MPIEPTKPKPDPKYGMAIGASRGFRGGTAGEAVNRGVREGGTKKPLPVGKKGPALSKRVDLAKAAANRLRGKM